jgi:hypothetical protein
VPGLNSADVPLADSLPLFRAVIAAVAQSRVYSVKHLAELTGFSGRHVRYRLATARILGLLTATTDRCFVLSPAGRALLKTEPGSEGEKTAFRRAVARCPIVQEVAPDLLASPRVDIKLLGERISLASGLGAATAERRAVVLRAWQRDLS